MSHTTLIACKGARHVERDELDRVEPVEAPTATYAPVKHTLFLDLIGQQMHEAGFHIREVKTALSRGNARMFCTIDTSTNLNCGSVTLAIGAMNSTDRSLCMSFVAGSRVLACANLSLRSDMMAPVKKRHSKNGLASFRSALTTAVCGLDTFKQAETARIARFRTTEISDLEADAFMLRSYERGIISPRLLPDLIREYRKPSFDYGCPKNTLWVLEQAYTTVLGRSVAQANPQRFCKLSLRLQSLLADAAGVRPDEAVLALPA